MCWAARVCGGVMLVLSCLISEPPYPYCLCPKKIRMMTITVEFRRTCGEHTLLSLAQRQAQIPWYPHPGEFKLDSKAYLLIQKEETLSIFISCRGVYHNLTSILIIFLQGDNINFNIQYGNCNISDYNTLQQSLRTAVKIIVVSPLRMSTTNAASVRTPEF